MSTRPLSLKNTLIPVYEEVKESWDLERDRESRNPVIEGSEFAYKVGSSLCRRELRSLLKPFSKATDLVQINDDGVKSAAKYVSTHLIQLSYRVQRPHHTTFFFVLHIIDTA